MIYDSALIFQTLAMLKPKGIKVLGTMAMVRNSVGAGMVTHTVLMVSQVEILHFKYPCDDWSWIDLSYMLN